MPKNITNDGTKGGLLKGKPHYDKNGKPLGGIKAIVSDTNTPVELEGGEVIINKHASRKYWKELSKINQSAGNGVPIKNPNGSFDDDPEEYKDGGNVIQFNPNHTPSKAILNYAKKIKSDYPNVWDKGGNIFGNEAFNNLKRVSERGYWLDSEKWMYIKWRSYIARHKQDFRINGVIAMLKWVDKVNKGWSYMKDLIEAEIEKQYPKKATNKVAKMEKGGNLKNDCIDFINKSEAITKNGYYLHLKNLNNYVDAGDKIISNIKSLVLITYKSGGQSNLKVTDTINASELSSEIAELLDCEISVARIIVSEQIKYAKRFSLNVVKNIENENIIIADRDEIVCTNIIKKHTQSVGIKKPTNSGKDIGNKGFYKWFANWYESKSDILNIGFSLPNKLAPFKEDNVIILDLFEKIDQDIDAKLYLEEIVLKADEYGVTIYLEPMPIDYYTKFGFVMTSDGRFMKRVPKMAKGGSIQDLISKGVVQLKMLKTKPEHAKEYGLDAKNPLYIQNINIAKKERLKGIGSKVINYIDEYAIENGHDVVFGYISQKADFTKNSRKTSFSDVDLIKYWLKDNGYAINDDNNNFHKEVQVQYGKGGSTDNKTMENAKNKIKIIDHNDDVNKAILEVEEDAKKMSLFEKQKTFVLDNLEATMIHEKITWGTIEEINHLKKIGKYHKFRVVSMFDNGVQVFQNGGNIQVGQVFDWYKYGVENNISVTDIKDDMVFYKLNGVNKVRGTKEFSKLIEDNNLKAGFNFQNGGEIPTQKPFYNYGMPNKGVEVNQNDKVDLDLKSDVFVNSEIFLTELDYVLGGFMVDELNKIKVVGDTSALNMTKLKLIFTQRLEVAVNEFKQSMVNIDGEGFVDSDDTSDDIINETNNMFQSYLGVTFYSADTDSIVEKIKEDSSYLTWITRIETRLSEYKNRLTYNQSDVIQTSGNKLSIKEIENLTQNSTLDDIFEKLHQINEQNTI
jgi:hypothetical protein